MIENSQIDKKSLRAVTKTNPDWDELAKDCVAFANAYGGRVIIGIEDKEEFPPKGQKIKDDLPIKIQRQIQNRTINVSVVPQIKTTENNAEYIELLVQRTASTIAATSKGKYYVRVGDACQPLMPEDLTRLLTDKTAFVWETESYLKVQRISADESKVVSFIESVRSSSRVSSFIKSKEQDELLDYYSFTSGEYLTNLGVLWVGKREDRVRLQHTPSVQFIQYDELGQKIHKMVWDDYSLNPKELVEALLNEIPNWKFGIEIADGAFRKTIPDYNEVVVRELIANTIVHKPYTTRGDVFIKLYPNHLEIHNPGTLPLGVTPKNILHKSVQRNPQLCKVFYDLELMEKEGSGYDKIYEQLLRIGKPLPEITEHDDRVVVKIEKRIVKKEIAQFISKVTSEFDLTSKELISLGLIAQHTALTSHEIAEALGIETQETSRWIGQLLELELLKTKGKTKGKNYYVEPSYLRKLNFKGKTNLKRIEPHRLRELIIEDLSIYRESSIKDINERIGLEISIHSIRKQLGELIDKKIIYKQGKNKATKYIINKGY